MSVWLTIPSARPPEQVEPALAKWRTQGYKIALMVDWNPPGAPLHSRIARGDIMLCGGGKYQPLYGAHTKEPLDPAHRTYPPHFNGYPGYAKAVNALIVEVMKADADAEWFIAAGDDTLPDPTKRAEEIARECREYFGPTGERPCRYPTWGVMQPTGDPWRDVQGRIIERIAGSAWLGREWCLRINQGRGPLWPEYTHCFVDEELQCVAQKYGVFWQRPDLTHYHDHWARKRGDVRDMPPHLIEANSAEHWAKYKKLFTERKAAGFPGSEPL